MDKVLNRIRLNEVKKRNTRYSFQIFNISISSEYFFMSAPIQQVHKRILNKALWCQCKKKSKSVVKKLSSTSNILTKAHVS